MGEGRERPESQREGGGKGRRHVIEVRIRAVQCCLVFTCFSFPLSQLMCAFQCEYTHGLPYANTAPSLWIGTTRYLQLMFSLSGAPPANHALYERATEKATGHSFIMSRLHCATDPAVDVCRWTVRSTLCEDGCLVPRSARQPDPPAVWLLFWVLACDVFIRWLSGFSHMVLQNKDGLQRQQRFTITSEGAAAAARQQWCRCVFI